MLGALTETPAAFASRFDSTLSPGSIAIIPNLKMSNRNLEKWVEISKRRADISKSVVGFSKIHPQISKSRNN